MLFNPVKYILGSVVSWLVLVAVVAAVYLGYVTLQAQQYTPLGVADTFLELVRNPTDVVSGEEERRIDAILDTDTLSTRRFEELILSFRKLDETYPLQFDRIETDEPFATAYFNLQSAPEASGVELFLQETGQWYTGVRHRIFHVELTGVAALEDANLERSLLDTLEGVQESLGENLNKLRENYGQDVLDFVLPEGEESLFFGL